MNTVKKNARVDRDLILEGVKDESVYPVFVHIGHYQGYSLLEIFKSEREAVKFIGRQTRPKDYKYRKAFLR